MILFTFGQLPPAGCRELLAEIRQYVTSAMEQEVQRQEYRQSQTDRLFGSLLLTAGAYDHLEKPEVADSLAKKPSGATSNDAALFRSGMRSTESATRLEDDPKRWEPVYKTSTDGLLLLARDHEDRLDRDQDNAIRLINAHGGKVVGLESGSALRDPARGNRTVEHFGYLDGISQPLYMADSIQLAASEGRGPWNPSAPLSNVLRSDPGAPSSDGYGSFVVLRKLEQNVMAFNEAAEAIADRLLLGGADRARAGALLLGRFKDGTSICLQSTPGQPMPANDFNYTEDPHGHRCPFFAHARRVGPRSTDPDSDEFVRRQRITRRGITYGTRSPDLRDEPRSGVGLLFMGYVSSLAQFITVQAGWASNPQFMPGSGIDPVIGLPSPSAAYEFPAVWGGTDRTPIDWNNLPGDRRFVSVKGGEYFFAPSIPFLQSLG